MSVQVDGPNPLSADDDFTPPLRRLRGRGAHQTASDKRKPGQRAGRMAEHFSTVCHHLRFPRSIDIPGFLGCGGTLRARMRCGKTCCACATKTCEASASSQPISPGSDARTVPNVWQA